MEARATHGLTAAEKRSFIEIAARVRSNLIA
jgi:hypothetical protein